MGRQQSKPLLSTYSGRDGPDAILGSDKNFVGLQLLPVFAVGMLAEGPALRYGFEVRAPP